MIGQTLLHYTVVDRIGEGGMGVVYKGLDTQLDRFVALKVLPHDRLASGDAGRRFIQEARSASALNHPNIITIHHIGSHEDITFIAMELVSGRSLAELIPPHGLPLARALNLAVQIADGLAAAHRAGIVHRDIKPGNVMVGDDGRVKILDFGLAKPTGAAFGGPDEPTRAVPQGTGQGVIVGTVGYMSPEQAEGSPLDSRSDIFSFGVLLYEMVTGRRPFVADTPMKTLSAILRDAPKPVSEIAPGCPRDLERIIDRCLRKDPARRWQHMDDVRVALMDLKDESDSGRLLTVLPPTPRGTSRAWWPFAAVAGVLIVAAVAWMKAPTPDVPNDAAFVPVPLTTYPGDERDPALSPDGTQVAFSWGPEGGVTNTYVKLIGPGEPIRLTNSPFTERMSHWSPDGRWIAFGRRETFPLSDFVVVPALGGPERRVAQSPSIYVFWTPDSEWLVLSDGSPAGLYLWPLHGGEKKLVVGPLEGTHSIGGGRISPDGRTAAVMVLRNGRRPLYVLPLNEGYTAAAPLRALTPEDWDVASWAWTPDGRDIVFIRVVTGSNLGGITAMYRVAAAGGTPKRLEFAGDNPWFLDVAARGNRLAYTRLQRDVNVYAAELGADGAVTSAGRPIASSSRRDIDPDLSPDGARVVLSSDREGSSELWVVQADGRNPVQLTQVGRQGILDAADWPRWSPDGKQIAFTTRTPDGGPEDIFVVDATGGTPRRITTDASTDTRPSWSKAGKFIHYVSDRDGAWRVWTVPVTGGEPRRVSSTAAFPGTPYESPDGEWVYFSTSSGVHRASRTGRAEEVVIKDRPTYFRPTTRGLFYLSRSSDQLSAELFLAPLAGGAARRLGVIPHYVVSGPSFSPDFSRMFYARCDQCAADIMLVENFR